MRSSGPSHAQDRASTEMRFVLPVSGLAFTLRQPTGAEDVLVTEHRAGDPSLVLALLERLGHIERSGKALPEWSGLPVVDADTAIVRLRQMLLGDRIVAEINCGDSACASRVDLSFGLEAYLDHNRAERRRIPARLVESCEDAPGWYRLHAGNAEACFRLPTLEDQIAVYGSSDAEQALASRCIAPDEATSTRLSRVRARAEAAMEAMAPPLSGPLQGRCPDCGTQIIARFEARLYCLAELRDRARFIYDDVDTLAERYHWSERAILALTQARRAHYVERAHQTAVA